jgi:hypothetical protein
VPYPTYFRKQAETCLRLSQEATGEAALRLVEMAQDYLSKAAAVADLDEDRLNRWLADTVKLPSLNRSEDRRPLNLPNRT